MLKIASFQARIAKHDVRCLNRMKQKKELLDGLLDELREECRHTTDLIAKLHGDGAERLSEATFFRSYAPRLFIYTLIRKICLN
jgi:hypothetical protein